MSGRHANAPQSGLSALARTLALACALVCAAGVAAVLGTFPAFAQRFETRAAHALLMDAETETVLFQHEADAPMPPASMAKLMTMAVIFDGLKTGRLSLDDEFLVSENAWRTGGASSGGSTMFAALGSSIRLEDLIRGIIIQSGNDACIIVAEGMAGTEATFANMMNEHARRLGLTGSNFTNSTGLPDPDQYVTVRDLAKLANHVIETYPEYYAIYSEPEFTWNKIRQSNRNPLLGMNIGADGMKTGYTAESGYGLVGSAVRDGQRLILVINGTSSEKERAEEARKLMDWGFRAFERVNLFTDGEVIADARVFHGEMPGVGVVSKGPVDILLPRGFGDQIRGRIVYQGPIEAPIDEGQEIGTLQITVNDQLLRETKVYAAADVDVGGLQQRALDGLQELLLGWW
jgi:serine-type D-Ala-D-Ala carboxypeptidase (penicillin-binding protein 5/6)